MRPPLKNSFQPLLLILASLLLMTAVVYIRYCSLARQIFSIQRPPIGYPLLSRSQERQLGWAHQNPPWNADSYVLHPFQKKSAAVRIGIFGCSIVDGAETNPGNKITSFLEKMLRRQTSTPIEVITFGTNAYSLSQMYLLWEHVGRRFNLDYVIVLPFAFHYERDRTFCADIIAPFPQNVHSRFILAGKGIQRLDPLGTDVESVAKNYYRFLTPWQYLRYDIKMPLWLKACLPSALQTRTNPFYYRRGKGFAEEIPQLYTRILSQWSKQARHFIILTADNEMDALCRSGNIPGAIVLPLQSPRLPDIFFLRAPMRHYSALQNYLVAQELFSFFSGNTSPRVPTWSISLLPDEAPPTGRISKPLHTFTKIGVGANNNTVGRFYSLSSTPKSYELSPVDTHATDTVNLLYLPLPRESWLAKAIFVPLSFPLPEHATLTLSNRSGISSPVNLGTIECRNGIIGWFSAGQLSGLEPAVSREIQNIISTLDKLSGKINPSSPVLDEITLSIGDKSLLADCPKLKTVILSAILRGYIPFPGPFPTCGRHDIWYLAAPPEAFPKCLLEQPQTINMWMEDNRGSVSVIPLYRCSPYSLNTNPFPMPLLDPRLTNHNQPIDL